ncbi:TonB-dependent receptor [Flavobacterium sufflavum]|uniref:TonB-dependent receptor n=1 Tax=Flavobacterium sufflavum TaxID=1921138 RepID=A0A3S2XKW5_9FLAO|nr:TonB-dependent receptor [Flavobacterium sufflavum]RVT78506.1 TonB-dependent receptor [Flavobacterium sufflavum]
MKNSLIKGLMVFLTMLCTSLTYSQEVSGTVSDPSGPLPGATILVKGTTNGVQTDPDGKFTIRNVGSDAILVFSYIGLKTQEVNVAGKKTINVILKDDSAELKEVVVIGYGTVKKKDATGAVESIKAADFNKGVTTSPEQLLQGKSAGVQVTQASGEPGGSNTVKIRGTSSIRSGSEPLYVVDGVPIGGGNVSSGTTDVGVGAQTAKNPLNFINPSDIASMDVLKDASATAIYGSRGANGVIIITTKKGTKGAGQLVLNTSYTTATIAKDYDLLNAAEFKAANPTADFGSSVNAFDAILRTAVTKQIDLAYSGGGDNGTYRYSMGYTDQEGIVKNTGLTKYNLGSSITHSMFDNKLKFEGNIQTSFIHDKATSLSDNVGAEGDLFVSAVKWNPTRAFFNPDGSYVKISNNQRNPMDLLDRYTDYTNTARILGNVSATYKLAKGLDYKVGVGVDYSSSNRNVGMSKLLGIDPATSNGGIAVKSYVERSNYLVEQTLNYSTDITKELKLNAIGGYSFQKFSNQGNTFVGTGFGQYTDQGYYIKNITAATNFAISGANAQTAYFDPSNKLQSYFGRAILTYSDKYIFSAVLRRDGSSKFGSSNKYGTFPALSVAWKIIEEPFIPKVFSDLKLRVGWGITGNQEFPAGAASTLVKPVEGVPTISNIGNPDLKWEQTAQYSAGVDFGILENKLTGSFDYYKKVTSDPLLQVPVADPSLYATKWANLPNAEITSQGVEIALNYKIIDKDDFSWDLGGNIAFNKGKVTGLIADGYPTGIVTGTISGQGLSGTIAQGHFDGQSTYTFNLLQFTGFDSNGKSTYKDLNGDNQITDADRAFSGSANPKFNAGLNTSIHYKNWDFVASGYGAYGQKIYNNTENALFVRGLLTTGNNVPAYVVNNGEATSGNSNGASTRFLKSGDFFRLSNVQIGYTFKGGEKSFAPWMKSLRVYFTASNLFVITPYNGLDPEVNSNKQYNGIPSLGIDYATYPKSRSFAFGLNVNL